MMAYRSRIGRQIYRILENFGAQSDVLGVIGSYGAGLADDEVLFYLTQFADEQDAERERSAAMTEEERRESLIELGRRIAQERM